MTERSEYQLAENVKPVKYFDQATNRALGRLTRELCISGALAPDISEARSLTVELCACAPVTFWLTSRILYACKVLLPSS